MGFLSAGKAKIVTQNSLTGTEGVSLFLLVLSGDVTIVPLFDEIFNAVANAESVRFDTGTDPFMTEFDALSTEEVLELDIVSFNVPLLKLLFTMVVWLTTIVLLTYVIFPGTLAVDTHGIVTV